VRLLLVRNDVAVTRGTKMAVRHCHTLPKRGRDVVVRLLMDSYKVEADSRDNHAATQL